jgi:hypothetical protein
MSIARTLRNDREKMGEHPMYRPSRGHGQAQPQPHQATGSSRIRRSDDPLAELARLIGQEDPFKEFDAVQPRRAAPNGNGAHHAPAVAPERRPERYTNGNGGGYSNGAGQPQRQPVARHAQPAAAPARGPVARADERYPAQHPSRTTQPQPQARANGAARSYEDQQRPAPRTNGRDANGHYAERSHRARDTYAEEDLRQREAPAPRSRRPEPQQRDRYVPEEAPRHARSRPQQAPYQDPRHRRYENDYDPRYDDEAYLPEQHDEEIYDDVQRSRRGWGFWVVAAIIVASLIAVAFLGVFAYRTIFNAPPRAAVVTKSNAPTKVEPKNTPQQLVSPSNKPIQDRLGGADTQIMRREEAPADLTRQNPQAPQQQQSPQQQAPVKNNPAFTPPPQQQQQQAPQTQQNLDQQPKRVKTVPLRADGSLAQPNAQQQQQNTGPMQLQAPQTQDQDTQAIPPQNQNRQNNSNVQQPNRNVASLGPTPLPQQQQQSTTANGNYIVQVASHKTPEEAQQAWTTLRQQYGTILGSRNADIRKVDLGDRGTFYRAMVGPMSRDQANALCQNLKTQGAGCIVQTRN